MYAAHAFLPLILVVLAARRADLDRSRTILAAALAAGFGLLPDVDLVYTVYAVARRGPTDVFPTTEHVWTESWVVHRTLTHSWPVGAVVVAIAAAVSVAVSRRGRDSSDRRGAGATQLDGAARAVATPAVAASVAALFGAVGLLALAVDADGLLGAITVGLYVAGAAALARFGARRGLSPAWIALAAALGIALHPPGDLWMGRPPAALYPLSTATLPEIRLAADPTLHFVGAVLAEVALLCGSLAALQVARERPLADAASGWSLLGSLQLLALWLVDPPTFVVAYRFSALLLAISVVAAGLAALTLRWRTAPVASRTDLALRAVGAGAGAAVVGLVAYALAFVVA